MKLVNLEILGRPVNIIVIILMIILFWVAVNRVKKLQSQTDDVQPPVKN